MQGVGRGEDMQGPFGSSLGSGEEDPVVLHGVSQGEAALVGDEAQLVARFEAGLAGYTYLWSECRAEARPSPMVADTATTEPTVQ